MDSKAVQTKNDTLWKGPKIEPGSLRDLYRRAFGVEKLKEALRKDP